MQIIISVNTKSLVGLDFDEAMQIIARAKRPTVLEFKKPVAFQVLLLSECSFDS